MIEITADTIRPDSKGVLIGCTIRYGDDGPVRFVRMLMPWSLFDRETRQEMLSVFDSIAREEMAARWLEVTLPYTD